LNLSRLLRLSRRRSGLTFREAHRLTCAIAQILGDENYHIALGLLSDYEAMERLPRHIAKIISLCVTYGMDLGQFLAAGAVHIDDSGKAALMLQQDDPELHSDSLDPAQPSEALGLARSV
jgi:hypothetical protein